MNIIQKQIDNCILALKLWRERVKPEDVSPRLYQWKCGTQACFGGHLATWEEFKKLGVRSDSDGAPYISGYWMIPTDTVSGYLFGHPNMFKMVGHCDFDREGEMGIVLSVWGEPIQKNLDYEVVIHRLERQIAFLKASLS